MMIVSPASRGKRLRDDAHDVLSQFRRATVRRGQHVLLGLLLDGADTVTVEDVRDRLTIPIGVDPVVLGAVPRSLAGRGIIHSPGYVEARRATSHARPLRLWRLTDRAKALAWLVDNPLPETTRPPRDGDQFLLFAGGEG